MQAQHKGLGPPLHHKHTPGMNLGGDKALIVRGRPLLRREGGGVRAVFVCMEPETRTGARGFLTPCGAGVATDSTGFWFKAADEGRKGMQRFRGEPFRCLDLQTAGAHGDWAVMLGSIRQNGTAAFRDILCPQHLGLGGGVLHGHTLISDHKSF